MYKSTVLLIYNLDCIIKNTKREERNKGDVSMKRETVEKVLIEVGMPVKLKGFRYITDAVMLLDTEEWQNPKWTALYYKIAAMNQDSASKVERAIRNAFATTRNHVADYDLIEHYIGFTNCENSNSITYLYKNIKRDYPEAEVFTEEKKRIKTEAEIMESFNSVSADMIRNIVRQTLKEMLFEVV